MALTGTVLAPTHDVGSLRLTWWRRRPVRFAVGVIVSAGAMVLPYRVPEPGWHLSIGSSTLELAPENALFWVGLLLMPFLRKVSYRKRDVLPRVVRIPGGLGAYVVEQTFGEAEALRTEWCRNQEHAHPYESWREARTFFCRHDTSN